MDPSTAVTHFDASCMRRRPSRMPPLTTRGRRVPAVLRQQRLHVSTSFSNTQTACQKDLVWRRRSHLQSRCRSSSVEFGRPSTIVAIRMMPAPIPMQRSGPRTTFWSRDPTFVGRRARLATVKVLAPDELTRHRIHPETLSTGVRPYERTSEPARQPEPTNWCHGSPAEHAWSLLARGQPPSSPDGRGWPNRQSSPLMATFLMLSRSRGAIGRVRAPPGALSMAGRTTDGPDGRTDGSPE